MIKSVFYNSVLVSGLALMLVLPFTGFGFIGYNERELVHPYVLGASTSLVKESSVNVVDQKEFKVILDKDSSTLTIFNPIDEEYKGSEYKKFLIVPNEIKDSGIYGTFSPDYSQIDFASTDEFEEPVEFVATILVVR